MWSRLYFPYQDNCYKSIATQIPHSAGLAPTHKSSTSTFVGFPDQDYSLKPSDTQIPQDAGMAMICPAGIEPGKSTSEAVTPSMRHNGGYLDKFGKVKIFKYEYFP